MAWTPPFKALLKSFNANRVRYLVIGGYAVILHGHPRSTIDLDLKSLRVTKKASGRFQYLADLENLPEA